MISQSLKFKTILIFLCMLLIPAPDLYAALDINFELNEPAGTIGPTDDIVVHATLRNLSTSTEDIIFNSTGDRVDGLGPVGTATILMVPPQFSLADNYGSDTTFDFHDQFSGLTLMPGDSFNMIMRTYVAPAEGVSPGTYGPDEILFYMGSMQFTDTISRTVASPVAPEPVSSILFITGGMFLSRKHYLKKRK